MIMKKIIIAIALFAVSFQGVSGQTVYSLDDCKRMALENNEKIKSAQLKIEASEQDKRQAFTHYFPTVTAVGTAYKTNDGLASIDLLPLIKFDMFEKGISGGVAAVMPVFAGGRIYSANQLAKEGVEVSKIYLEQSRQEVELTAEQYYWQVAVIEEKLNTLKSVGEMLGSLRSDVKGAVDAGVTLRNDLLQVELKQNDIASTRLDLENNLSVCKMLLAQYIGADCGDKLEINANVGFDSVPQFPFELKRDHLQSLALTPEYRLLEKNVEVNELKHRQSIGENLPTVSIGGGYIYHNLLRNDHTSGIVFASVAVPISGWWSGSYKMKKQKLELKNAENERDDKSELLLIKMQKAWNDLENSYKQLDIARRSIEQSQENLRLNKNYYSAGTITMSDLLNAVYLAQQSRDKYVDAYSAFRIKELEYRHATAQ